MKPAWVQAQLEQVRIIRETRADPSTILVAPRDRCRLRSEDGEVSAMVRAMFSAG
jgi:hypothetical protein